MRNNSFSQEISVFHGIPLPEKKIYLAGYSAIINVFSLQIPAPETLSAISKKHNKYESGRWRIFTPRYKPDNTLYNHLVFALKHEGVNLAVLKALFNAVDSSVITKCILQKPTGYYSRRIWFLYEWLQQEKLNIDDIKTGNFVDVLDEKFQYPGPSCPSKRHRVRNNLPGVPGFCPLIRRTSLLDSFIAKNLIKNANENIGKIHPDILFRAAAFLLLKDSKASYAIEGETPSQSRTDRWGKVIGQAGRVPLSEDEILRLQKIVISDTRFVKMGYRKEGGFIGVHERSTELPVPDHISARWQDIPQLMESLIETDILLRDSTFDAVLAATSIGFGFVFIHPLEDGNGRLHRYLIHHVLAEKGVTPKGIIFPVSSVLLEKIDEYGKTLESYSKPRLEFIKWRPTNKGNIEVLNNTINLYRYFDATKQAEFLYACVQETIEKTLPEEIDYLKKYDQLKEFIVSFIDMPDRLVELLILFLNKGNGALSKRAKNKEFRALTGNEIKTIEAKYADIFSA